MARVHYRLAMELGGRPGNGEETVTAGERRKQQ
jgi:hypothetical protein